MPAVIAFIASGAVLAAFLLFKRFELARENRVAPIWRDELDQKTVRLKERLSRDMPRAARERSSYATGQLLHHAAQTGISFARLAERRLTKAADAIRGRHAIIKSERPSSAFLHDIAAHKHVLRNGGSEEVRSDETSER